MEAKLEKHLEEQSELQDVNDELLKELEKRDQAIEEAVRIICLLEGEVDRMKKEREGVQAFDDVFGDDYFGEQDAIPSSPPEIMKSASNRLPRMPSFLSENSEGAEALRSLYLPYPTNSEDLLPKLQEQEVEHDLMDSPRLSLLSESSFISVYGDKNFTLGKSIEEDELPHHESAVEKWVDERPMASSSPRPTPPLRKNQYLSINDVVASPLQRLEKLKVNMEKMSNNSSLATKLDRPTVKDKAKSKELRRVFTDQSSFEHQQTLPPTPDTISTGTLRHYQASTETLHQNSASRELISSRDASFQRPRSAGETITSRRDGHGWDTPSQETLTSYLSHSTEENNNGTTRLQATPKRIMTPHLFNFASTAGNEWGKDVMYNHDAALPIAARYSHLRHSSLVESLNSRSDDTATKYNTPARYQEPNVLYGTSPIDTTPKPSIGDRRSSLTAVEKMRKKRMQERENSQNLTINTGSNDAISPATSTNTAKATAGSPSINLSVVSTPVKKSRMPSLRIFGRSETSPLNSRSFSSAVSTDTKDRDSERASAADARERDFRAATPPPIRRNRTDGERPGSAGGYGAGMVASRPTVAHEMAWRVRETGREGLKSSKGRERRESVTAAAEKEREKEGEVEEGSVGKKKWFGSGFGVGRSVSVRR